MPSVGGPRGKPIPENRFVRHAEAASLRRDDDPELLARRAFIGGCRCTTSTDPPMAATCACGERTRNQSGRHPRIDRNDSTARGSPVIACFSAAAAEHQRGSHGDRRGVRSSPHHARRPSRRCPAPGFGVVLPVRLSGDVELPAHRERKQVSTYSSRQRIIRIDGSRIGRALGTAGRGR